jgi:hypothetical protein
MEAKKTLQGIARGDGGKEAIGGESDGSYESSDCCCRNGLGNTDPKGPIPLDKSTGLRHADALIMQSNTALPYDLVPSRLIRLEH